MDILKGKTFYCSWDYQWTGNSENLGLSSIVSFVSSEILIKSLHCWIKVSSHLKNLKDKTKSDLLKWPWRIKKREKSWETKQDLQLRNWMPFSYSLNSSKSHTPNVKWGDLGARSKVQWYSWNSMCKSWVGSSQKRWFKVLCTYYSFSLLGGGGSSYKKEWKRRKHLFFLNQENIQILKLKGEKDFIQNQ